MVSIISKKLFTTLFLQVYDKKIQFAPIGLIEMYNSGGAIEAMKSSSDSSHYGIQIKGRGVGSFGAYSSRKPMFCSVNSKVEEFIFNEVDNLLKVTVPAGSSSWNIDIWY